MSIFMSYNRITAFRYSIVLITAMVFACQPAPQHSTEDETTIRQEKKPIGLDPGSHRFCFVTNDDTALLTLHVGEDGVIAGTYMHQYSGKDRSDGDIENAYFKGDTLIADYNYWSEGIRSIREIRFVIQDGQAREGFGDITGEGEKLVYKNPAKLFYGGPLLSKATCGGNVSKIK